MMRLVVENLSHRYKSNDVLKELSFAIAPGEIVGLLGPNGAGKSTLLSLLCGKILVQQGQIAFDGRNALAHGLMTEQVRAQMGVMFQDTSLDKRLSALANLHFSASLYGVDKKSLKTRMQNSLVQVGLWEKAHAKVKTYSGGMQRRLELVRVFLHQPRLVLMDEPSAALDQQGLVVMWQVLQKAKTEGASMLIASHRLEDAEQCDRVLLMNEGRIVAEDSPAALKARVKEDQIELCLSAQHRSTQATYEARLKRLYPELVFKAGKGFWQVSVAQGASFVPRLVEALPQGAIESVHVRRPSLADAYHALTGSSLEAQS